MEYHALEQILFDPNASENQVWLCGNFSQLQENHFRYPPPPPPVRLLSILHIPDILYIVVQSYYK